MSSLEIVKADEKLTDLDKESIAAFSDALNYAKNATENPNFPSIQNELSYTLSNIMSQQTTIEDGLADAESTIEELMEE